MRRIKAKRMTSKNFQFYGTFMDLIDVNGPKIGVGDVEFYRDMVQGNIGNNIPSYSIVKTNKRAMVIDEAEQHFYCTETIVPLNDDIVIFVGESTDKVYPSEKIEAFIVPQNTIVVLKAGVWHKAPYPINKESVNTLVVLPERAYANDCYCIKLNEEEQIEIEI